ncbi:MAG: D-glycero-beta-D-manno-heptose 1-phosphate adenylyltransferase [Chitinophagaceae bacterium]|nr:D-glycero-beta-D-manno-heptose 1-phosphate adenylyltransferase [Chitinophagaceae bacterium]
MIHDKINIIERFSKLKVLIIGDGLLDVYIKGTTDRICREAPAPVFSVLSHKHESGGAANTAINVAMLGAEAHFLTVLGKDQHGRTLIEDLKKHKVHTEHIIQDKTRPTIAKKRMIAASTILLRVDEGATGSISGDCEQKMLRTLKSLYDQFDTIILSDYGYGTISSSVLHLLEELQESTPKKVIVDAKDLTRYKNIKPSAIKPNYEEAIHLLALEKITGAGRAGQVSAEADRLIKLTGASQAAVTLDSDGVLFIEKGRGPYRISCIPNENSRTIGAGDTFISALSLSLAAGADGRLSAEIAAAAAAVVVQKDGTSGCTNHELIAYINATPKYISCVEALELIAFNLRKQGKKIVFTNGCFDILHKGHVTLLNKARQSGDVLIVGLNTDESIRKVKGMYRPINRLEDRIAVLSGLSSVDYIIAFEEASPVKLIRAVHPHVFVKGGDYSEATIREAPLVKKLGGVIKIFPYTDDYSTSIIIERLRLKKEPATGAEDVLLAESN